MQTSWQQLQRWIEDLLFPIRMRLGRRIMWEKQRKIVQISRSTLIKGPVTAQEIEAMRFVAARVTTLYIPAVQRTYHRSDGVYLAMDFIAGERLDHLWPKLTEEGRKEIVVRVWSQVSTLRALPKPKSLEDVVVGSASSGGSVHDGFVSMDAVGPFTSLTEFCDFLRGNPNFEPFQHLLDRKDDDDGTGSDSVFNHADLAPRNIIIRESDDKLFLIDWEVAGWWPPWWDYVMVHLSDFPILPDWVESFDKVSGWDRSYGR